MELRSYAHSILSKIPAEKTALSKIWNSYHYNDSVERTLNQLIEMEAVELKTSGNRTYVARIVDINSVSIKH